MIVRLATNTLLWEAFVSSFDMHFWLSVFMKLPFIFTQQCGEYSYWILLEKLYTPLFTARVRPRPHKRTFWDDHTCIHEFLGWPYMYACVRVCGLQPINTSSPHSCWPIRSRLRPPHLFCSGALKYFSLVAFLGRVSPAGSVSLPTRFPWLTFTSPCWSLLLHSISQTNAYLSSLWGHSLY